MRIHRRWHCSSSLRLLRCSQELMGNTPDDLKREISSAMRGHPISYRLFSLRAMKYQ
ncbi:hypothetical protein JMJ77_0007178 [Colletotrichum scovillei]|uniref:Uncharacterized protein n=1 Tax=Colletotrichum scovillei TaxID=1209932 RepID=A0A9P7RDY8_9PEZI|nr:hypothetical protein JMJ77_0007178 [Colletotrichum scovillei]KAG7074144.1 hypothetical protein JMJ76_0010631 [Colletotrichum scovillei]KAG7081485.1 hypothetical protein JMJ78_0003605 [Colletotrichum scovillei]